MNPPIAPQSIFVFTNTDDSLSMVNSGMQLVVAGVNFRNTALETRNKFAFTTDNLRSIYAGGSQKFKGDFFILSTCNRTEIYSATNNIPGLLNLFTGHNNLSAEEVNKSTFVKTGNDAVVHLLRVASGLDSQILGDYEIIGQLKNAFALGKSYQSTSGYVEKLVNLALQTSREIKSQTSLSNGTTSVSYAAIQLLKQMADSESPLNICLLGLGKIGTLTLKNLSHYLPAHKVTLINRNEQRARMAATEYRVEYAGFDDQPVVLNTADVLIVATGADHPIITKADIEESNVKLIFDLSVPSNVHPEVKAMPGIKVYDIDELSDTVNKNIERRHEDVPVAEQIIEEHFTEFKRWETQRNLHKKKAATEPVAVLKFT